MQTLNIKSTNFLSNKFRILLIFLLAISLITLVNLNNGPIEIMIQHNYKLLLNTGGQQSEEFTVKNKINSSIPTIIYPNRKPICWDYSNMTENYGNGHRVIITFIHSARGNFDAREGIRKTWGSMKKYKNFDFDLIFVIGKEKNGSIEEDQLNLAIKEESENNGDILLGSFIDSYRNLTYKHLSGYKWIIEECPMANYIIKADDDVFFNLQNGLKIISDVDTHNSKNPSNPFSIFGCYWTGQITNLDRNLKNKRGVSKEEFPISRIPPYCYGALYGLTIEAAKNIYSVRTSLPYLFIDDVFVTGFLREEYEKMSNSSLKYYGDSSGNKVLIDGEVEEFSFDNICKENSSQVFQLKGKKDKSSIFTINSILALSVPRINIISHMSCLWSRIANQL